MANPYLGEIRIFPFNFAPVGWAQCNGQVMYINQSAALFSLLGTTYGGNGQTTFQLPDLQGRVPINAGNGAGLAPYVLGQIGGLENVTLQQTNMPAHTHLINASSGSATSSRPAGAVLARASGEIYATAPDGSTTLAASTVASAGGSAAFSVRQPYLALNFCIALTGIFPTRN